MIASLRGLSRVGTTIWIATFAVECHKSKSFEIFVYLLLAWPFRAPFIRQ